METSRKTVRLVCCGAVVLVLGMGAGLIHRQAFAKTTYHITDGSRVLVHTTDARDVETVLSEAGVMLEAEDTYTHEPTACTISVNRGMHVAVEHHGERMETFSSGETVWQLLERMGIDWGERDRISASLDQEVYDGMVLKVELETYEIQTYTAVLPYETVCCSDPTLSVGQQQILIRGQNGRVRCTAFVTYVNGQEESREILREDVTVQPVRAVVAVGTGQLGKAPEERTVPEIGNGLIHLPTGEVLTYSNVLTSLATAYCDKGLTATGTQARVGAIAVDPRCIPYGTRMFIVSMDGEYVYGIATAEDCGSKEYIYDTRIDLHFDTYQECRQFGARWCNVYILG